MGCFEDISPLAEFRIQSQLCTRYFNRMSQKGNRPMIVWCLIYCTGNKQWRGCWQRKIPYHITSRTKRCISRSCGINAAIKRKLLRKSSVVHHSTKSCKVSWCSQHKCHFQKP